MKPSRLFSAVFLTWLPLATCSPVPAEKNVDENLPEIAGGLCSVRAAAWREHTNVRVAVIFDMDDGSYLFRSAFVPKAPGPKGAEGHWSARYEKFAKGDPKLAALSTRKDYIESKMPDKVDGEQLIDSLYLTDWPLTSGGKDKVSDNVWLYVRNVLSRAQPDRSKRLPWKTAYDSFIEQAKKKKLITNSQVLEWGN